MTGAASGIGRALALSLADAGARLSLADIDSDGLDAVAQQIRRVGGRVDSCVVDVTDSDTVQLWARNTVIEFDRVDMVWNVAGIISAGDVLQCSLDDLDRIMAVDFRGTVSVTKAFLPHVIASPHGRIVNVSSAFGGLITAPAYGSYNAAKAAVRAWTDTLRQEMKLGGHSVAVTCVVPGGIRTPIMRRSSSAHGPDDAMRRQEFFERHVARTSAERAAELILRGVAAGRPRVIVGADARVADLLARITATGYERLIPPLLHLA